MSKDAGPTGTKQTSEHQLAQRADIWVWGDRVVVPVPEYLDSWVKRRGRIGG